MKVGRSVPVRTCVGCRARSAKTDLLRVVVVEDTLVPDPRGRLPGRGASVHPDPRCLDLAERRRAFSRALRLPGPLNASMLREHVETVTGRQGVQADLSRKIDEHRAGSGS